MVKKRPDLVNVVCECPLIAAIRQHNFKFSIITLPWNEEYVSNFVFIYLFDCFEFELGILFAYKTIFSKFRIHLGVDLIKYGKTITIWKYEIVLTYFIDKIVKSLQQNLCAVFGALVEESKCKCRLLYAHG